MTTLQTIIQANLDTLQNSLDLIKESKDNEEELIAQVRTLEHQAHSFWDWLKYRKAEIEGKDVL